MMGWCSKQRDLESTEGKGTPSLCSSALAHRVNEHWKNIWWIESLDVRPEHRHTLIAPKIPCFSSYTEEKAFILCVSTTKGGLLHFNHHSLSKRRIPCVIAEQEWFLGINASSKLHSQLHHRFLLSVSCTQHKERGPTFNCTAMNLPSKVEILRLSSDRNEHLLTGAVVQRHYFGWGWAGAVDWLNPESPHSALHTHGLVQALLCTCAAVHTSAGWA